MIKLLLSFIKVLTVTSVSVLLSCSLESDYLRVIKDKMERDFAGEDQIIPDDVKNLLISEAGAGEIVIEWTDPEEPTYSHAEISWTPDGSTVHTVSKGDNNFTLTELAYGQRFTITVVSVSESDGRSPGVSIAMTIPDSFTSIHCIRTAAELEQINSSPAAASRYYLLLNDISLSDYNTGSGWVPIGSAAQPFMGTFDGNYFNITDIYVTRLEDDNGLFGNMQTGTVLNLNLSSVTIHCNTADRIGGLVGSATAGSVIKNVQVRGNISGGGSTGGIVGFYEGDLQNSFSAASVNSETGNAGGLIGTQGEGPVTNSFSIGTVHSTAGSDAGGLIGSSSNGSISFSYAKSQVTGAANRDGLISERLGSTVTSSYFDAEFYMDSSAPDPNEERTTAQMKNQGNYSGWDFTDIWDIDTSGSINEGYPYLRWMES